ncbi:MAG: patatin-like phospholipase family protein [Planctomycetota bacterium]
MIIPLGSGTMIRADDPLLASCEELWWLARPELAGLAPLNDLLAHRRTLQGRARLVWTIREGERPPTGVRPDGLVAPEFRVFLGPSNSRRERLSLRRVVNFLEGRRIGLALGGGGARGFAHCGVLKVLDEEELAIDRIAGTSMGALVGHNYAAGTVPDEIVGGISVAAQAPLFLRLLPHGRLINFAWKARTGAYERALRSIYGRDCFEELDFPLQIVTSDLVGGTVVVRREGDCTDAVIESINLPLLAPPILRDGKALVDGGILNNLPTDLLVEQGLETILAVDVMVGSEDWKPPARHRLGVFESLLRVAELQHMRLTQHGARSADHLLRVNLERFSLTDFESVPARAIAAAGEEAARQALPTLRALLAPPWRTPPAT